ncbi:hypothetical protein Pint_32819 [Pistacia integerrima]|uniref:Uncharacterized protein n=1 Tax=Pistacia integerrima TaxID=434235 RepID=A0ACC0X6F7_9ROSI|nr:hypothetical protein Pint_32819 [Pistacia integerrima]
MLPKLKILYLKGLAKLVSFFPEKYDACCPALEEFTVKDCSKLTTAFIGDEAPIISSAEDDSHQEQAPERGSEDEIHEEQAPEIGMEDDSHEETFKDLYCWEDFEKLPRYIKMKRFIPILIQQNEEKNTET